jgi:hypothetical protein
MSPVIMEARAGEHTGETQKKFSKRTPLAARSSSTGVFISSLPPQPSAHAPWSSLMTKSTFGRFGSWLGTRDILRSPVSRRRCDRAAVRVEPEDIGEPESVNLLRRGRM